MRIVCPNCASQYEVAPEVIPEAGRDVQCANCAEIWFQNWPMQLTLTESSIPLETSSATAPQVSEEPTPKPAAEPEITPEPEVAPTPPAPQTERVSEASTVFRSLRSDRDPTPAPSAIPTEPEQRQRQSISPEVQNILQQEAEFAANQQNKTAPAEPITELAPEIQKSKAEAPEQITPQPDATDLSHKMSVLEQEREQLVRKQAETDPSQSVTLASAKSLRDILEAEAIDPVDLTDDLPTPIVDEPSLETLGFKRATSIIQREEAAPTFKPATSYLEQATPEIAEPVAATLDDTVAKTGKAVFANIDEINPNNADDETDSIKDDLIDSQDGELQETASKYSIGFLAACILAILATTLYMFAPKVAGSVPAVSGFMTSYHTSIDDGRMVLQDMYYQGGEPGFDTLFKNAKAKIMQ